MSEKRPLVVCAGCGATIFDEDVVYVQPFITSICGLRRGVDGAAHDTPQVMEDGREVKIYESPTTCAKPSCVEKVLADQSWTRIDLDAERRRRKADMAKYEAKFAQVDERALAFERERREQAARLLAILESLGACARSRSVSLAEIQTAAAMALEAAEPYLAYVRDIVHPPSPPSEPAA